MVNNLVKQIDPALIGKQIKSIYGVPRGGLVVAVMLSHRLNLPLTNKINSKVLIVDDISDRGDTLTKLEEKEKVNFVATLITRTRSKFWPDFTAKLTSDKDFYVFPWETIQSAKRDNTKI